MPEQKPKAIPDSQENPPPAEGKNLSLEEIKFAHASEKVCAEILDFYGIKWLYEPKGFPLKWDKKGNVIQSFTPDFYLTELDLYIELTTMSQKLVTKKNRKIRQLRELYPNVNIKIFYQKDFRNLLLKYGLDGKLRDILPED